MPIKNGDLIKLIYIGKLENGTIFDKLDEKNPIKFKVGNGTIIKGINKAVIGMEKGEEKNIKILPEDAYGQRKKDLVIEFDREIFPDDIKIDTVLYIYDKNGNEIPGRIIKITTNKIYVDLNHPLSGEILYFYIKIIDIIDNSEEKK
ncbi:MAG: FKBP-type peptidyl-prolyl cis-trans isomerase [Promethearchaeota archaeon]